MADEGGRDAGLWAMAALVTPMAVRVAATLRVAELGKPDLTVIADGDVAFELGTRNRLRR